MPELSSSVHSTGGVTFVEVVVSAETPHRVRIESRLDGPVWPPRTRGNADGWDDASVTRRIGAGRTAVGFATPADASTEPPVRLATAESLGVDSGDLPTGVAAWLREIDSRLERAEALTAVEDLDEATQAVAEVGGLAGVERLEATIAADRRALEELSIAPERLCERADAVEIPTEAFRRLG